MVRGSELSEKRLSERSLLVMNDSVAAGAIFVAFQRLGIDGTSKPHFTPGFPVVGFP